MTNNIDFDTDMLLDVNAAAVAWWRSKRPARWTLEDHLTNYYVNCTSTAEINLAEKVRILVMENKG